MHDPTRPWKTAAFSQFPSPVRLSRPEIQPEPGDLMGRAIRTDRHRLIRWEFVTRPEETAEVELYDLQTDPGETTNLAHDPDYADTVKELTTRLRAGWKAATPGSAP